MLTRFTISCLVLAGSMLFAPALAGPKPLSTRVLSVPQVVPMEGKEVVSFEVRNKGDVPVTLCALKGPRVDISCRQADGSGVGIGWGPGPSRYDRDDFFTLAPGEARQFDVPVSVPEECESDVVTVSVSYNSQYDGSEVGIRAWTGELKVGRFRIPISTR